MTTQPVDEAGFKLEVAETAGRVLESLASGKARTAWELKMQLKVSHTKLHMAIGMLLERGGISVRPDRLTYALAPASAAAPQGSPAEAPAAQV